MKDVERLSLAIFTDSIIQESLINHEQVITANERIYIKNQLHSRLFNHAYPRFDVDNILIYTLDGTVYEYSNRGYIDVRKNAESKSWLNELDLLGKNELLLIPPSETIPGSGQDKQVLSLARNIYHIPQRNKIGTVEIQLNVQSIEDLFAVNNHYGIEENMRVFIMTDDGDVIYDSMDQFIGEKNQDLVTSILQAENQNGIVSWESDQYLYSLKKSNYTKWNSVVLVSNEFILTEQRRILRYIAYIGILSTIVIAMLSYILSHNITSPLRKLMIKMKRVEKGELSGRMKYTGNAEIDLLNRIYNNMLDSINKLITEVYESKLAEKNSKISALQSQINPHFLYNTLNIMKSISRIKGVEEVAEISESLADLFKYSMKHLKKPVPLKDELEHVENYMRIQQYRFGERFSLTSEIPDNLLQASVPKLTVQPIIENAVNHGLSNVKGGGLIDLKVRLTTQKNKKKLEDILIITVTDNGQGMNEETLTKLQGKLHSSKLTRYDDDQGGIGLVNIQQRIQLLHGPNYGLKIDSVLDKGTTVMLELPFNTYHFEEGRGNE
jgi:two-component system sensor histidine kinase YesM